MAIEKNNLEFARLVIEHGASVNASYSDGVTALMKASCKNQVDMARLLISRGADVNATLALNGMTPLMFATSSDRLEVTKLLLKHGANKSVAAHSGNRAVDMTEDLEIYALLTR